MADHHADGTTGDAPARPSGRSRLLGLLLVVQILLIGAGFGVWRWTIDAPPPPPLPAAEDATIDGPPTLENGLVIASKQAAAWQDGARLLDASVQVDWPWEPPPPGPAQAVPDTGWLIYIFVAPWDPPGSQNEAATLTVLINRLTGQITSRATLGWEEAPTVDENAATPVVPSAGALLAAEAAGGTDFRRACPVERHLSRGSFVTGTAFPPHWLVTYRDQREPDRHGLIVRIDGVSGEVLAIEREAPPCP